MKLLMFRRDDLLNKIIVFNEKLDLNSLTVSSTKQNYLK